MLAAKFSLLARLPAASVPALRQSASGVSRVQCALCRGQKVAFSQQTRTSSLRKLKQATLRERAMAPAGDSAFTIGKGFAAGAAVVGLGGLCFYGMGLSKESGAIDRATLWPEVVRDRVKSTYMYFGGSLVFTAASAIAISRSPRLMQLVTRKSWLALGATLAAMLGSGMLVRALPYEPGLGPKQLAWMVHTGVIGAVIAPLTLLGGPLLLRAACYTAGIVGGLSTLAVCAPSDKFLNMGGPLAMGLGVVLVSSLGGMFLPPTTALGAGLYSVALYGGLVLFGAFLLYDTQKVIYSAETYPVYTQRPFDPINASVGIYMDTINIFIRIATMLAGGGNRKR